jgi:hypothetical protein
MIHIVTTPLEYYLGTSRRHQPRHPTTIIAEISHEEQEQQQQQEHDDEDDKDDDDDVAVYHVHKHVLAVGPRKE